MKLTFTIEGPPKPKERPRVSRKGAYTPKPTKDYQEAVGSAAFTALNRWLREREDRVWPMNAHYSVTAHFRHKKALGGCPDGDNCMKAVQDALEGILYSNDRLVLKGTYMTFPGEAQMSTWVEVEVL